MVNYNIHIHTLSINMCSIQVNKILNKSNLKRTIVRLLQNTNTRNALKQFRPSQSIRYQRDSTNFYSALIPFSFSATLLECVIACNQVSLSFLIIRPSLTETYDCEQRYFVQLFTINTLQPLTHGKYDSELVLVTKENLVL